MYDYRFSKEIPDRVPCLHGCHEYIKLGKEERKVSVEAVLDPRPYHFLNTGEPYYIRTCPKCHRSTLICGVD